MQTEHRSSETYLEKSQESCDWPHVWRKLVNKDGRNYGLK